MDQYSNNVLPPSNLCNICHKSLTNKQSLRRHMKRHYLYFGEFQFVCGVSVCKQRFYDTDQLHRHVLQDHPNHMICVYCKEVVLAELMGIHLLEIHVNNNKPNHVSKKDEN